MLGEEEGKMEKCLVNGGNKERKLQKSEAERKYTEKEEEKRKRKNRRKGETKQRGEKGREGPNGPSCKRNSVFVK